MLTVSCEFTRISKKRLKQRFWMKMRMRVLFWWDCYWSQIV